MKASPAGGDGDESRRIEQEVLRVLQETPHDAGPVVTLSWARSVTGAIAAADGARTALSGSESLLLTHRLRAMHGAILVGIQTVLSDDPLLTVRLLQGAQPQPVVLDSRLRFPPEAHLLSRADMKPWIFHSEEEGSAAMREQRLARALRLVRKGARLFPVRRNERGLDLHQVLSTLLSEGIHSLMVEGGARVLESFMSQDLASQAVITVSPLRIEGIQGPRMPGTGFSLRERYGGDEVVWVHFRARSCDLFDGG